MLLYDLAGADERLRWSPFCWRVKLALKHKQLPYDTVPWHYFQKDLIAPSGHGAVPVLVVGDRYLADSWEIAEHLEAAHPHRRPLFREPAPHALTLFIKHWVEAEVHAHLRHLTMLDMLRLLDPRDQAYFRTSREQVFGQPLEAFCADRAHHRQQLQRSLDPARRLLLAHPFLCGTEPGFGDHLLLSALLWGWLACGEELLAPDDPVARWRDGLMRHYEISLSP